MPPPVATTSPLPIAEDTTEATEAADTWPAQDFQEVAPCHYHNDNAQ